MKLLLFANGIKSNKKSPAELQAIIDLPVLTENVTELNKSPPQGVYELRRGRTLVKNIIPETKYETLTFKYFFPELLSTFKSLDFSLGRNSFRTQVNLDLKESFSWKIPKIWHKIFGFFSQKLIKSKRNKRKWRIIFNT